MVEKVCARTGWFTMLLCALGTAQASAQNAVSQELLELSEDQRNAAFIRLLRASDQKRDQVVRTLMRPVAHVPAFGREPPRDAFECAECGHVESFIRESRT